MGQKKVARRKSACYLKFLLWVYEKATYDLSCKLRHQLKVLFDLFVYISIANMIKKIK